MLGAFSDDSVTRPVSERAGLSEIELHCAEQRVSSDASGLEIISVDERWRCVIADWCRDTHVGIQGGRVCVRAQSMLHRAFICDLVRREQLSF